MAFILTFSSKKILSPLLFVLPLMPVSSLLNPSGNRFQVTATLSKFSRLFYLDDLKLYAKNQNELESLLHTNAMRCNIFHLPVSLSCQLCGSHDETIDHLISGCEVITQRLYKHHHDEMARMLHWGLAKLEGLEIVPNWWNHKYV